MDDAHLTLAGLHAAYSAGTHPHDIVDRVLARIEDAADPGIFIHLESRARLMAAVAALGEFDPLAKPLWGVPFAVKDNIDVAGVPTTAACPDFAYVPQDDAPVVARLKAAGALFIGKTNLDQFATGLVGVRTPYPVPRNALDPTLVPGGSSSGSAVATARGIVTFALGTDTAGSGRVPAALNGIVGLKPSLGALSTRGVVPACRTLDCVSIFATRIDDARQVFEVAAAYDAADPFAQRQHEQRLPLAPAVGIPSAASIRFFGDAVQEAAFTTALDRLQAAGARIVEVDFAALYAVADLLYEGAWVAERLAVIADFMASQPDSLHPVTRHIIASATSLSAVDAFTGLYRLQALKREVDTLLAGIDLLCVPSTPTIYTLEDVAADPIGPNARLGTYTNFVNLLGMCALAVPAAPRADGLPFGVTLLAAGGCDRALAGFAMTMAEEHAAKPAIVSESDDIEIVVVGAHLSGLPLNHELTERGATLVRTATTAPHYRLFALPGTSPAKPGLLRVGPAQGGAVAIEVWSMAPTAFASFVAAIPAPLGIGRIALADGSAVQGFLVESIATEGAEDVTRFGGWRSYIAALRAAATPAAPM